MGQLLRMTTRAGGGAAARRALLAGGLALGACSGAIDAGGGEGAGAPPRDDGAPGLPAPGGAAPGGTPGPSGALAPEAADRSPFRRLTRLEYDETVKDLLGDASRPGTRLLSGADTQGSAGFYTSASPSTAVVRSLLEAAESVAAAAVPRLPALLGCAAGAPEAACATGFLARFAPRAYRRPATPAELAELEAFYAAARREPGATFQDAMRLVLTRILMAPQFLYRWELGPQPAAASGGLVKLGGYELASRLSYFLWGTMPDEALFAAAKAGALDGPDGIAKEARRLLADPRAAGALDSFHHQWLDLGRLTSASKQDAAWTPAVQDALYASTQAFARHVFVGGDGRLGTLLLSPAAFVDGGLAKLYGIPAPAGRGLVRVELDPGQRAGVLTQAGLLAGLADAHEGSAILRGKLVRERFLCEPLPPPPPGVDTTLPPAKPGVSERGRLEQHMSDATCAGCHKLMDPIGFGFEHYDALGRWRVADRVGPVDARGRIEPTGGGAAQEFRGALELAGLLAKSEQVSACVARQWYRFALGRLEGGRDAGSLARASAALRESGDLRELLLAIVQTKAFTYRAPFEGEVLR